MILYHNVVDSSGNSPPAYFEELFRTNGWAGSWRNGVYPFHHYHSTAHEVLGVYSGSAQVLLGGEEGSLFELKSGDVVIIPAGVSHKRISSAGGFAVVGAYPRGTAPDMCYGKENELEQAVTRINALPLPESDPVLGSEGLANANWRN